MTISNEHDEHSAYSSGDVIQWLMIAAIVVSGVAVTAVWLYLQW
jgi:multisubunit Na+/H+ antiporter MnhC subunit